MFIIVNSCPECAGVKPVILKAVELFNTRVCNPVTFTKELFNFVAVRTAGAGGFTLSTAANAVDRIDYIVHTTSLIQIVGTKAYA